MRPLYLRLSAIDKGLRSYGTSPTVEMGQYNGGNWTLAVQIATDRYHAAHLLGDLKDARSIPILVPLLKDKEVNSIVPWALGEIGDKSAIPPLIETLVPHRISVPLRKAFSPIRIAQRVEAGLWQLIVHAALG
jgi:HEAT repeats